MVKDFVVWYFSTGAVIYLIFLAANFKYFLEACIVRKAVGFVSFIAWPLVVYLVARED